MNKNRLRTKTFKKGNTSFHAENINLNVSQRFKQGGTIDKQYC